MLLIEIIPHVLCRVQQNVQTQSHKQDMQPRSIAPLSVDMSRDLPRVHNAPRSHACHARHAPRSGLRKANHQLDCQESQRHSYSTKCKFPYLTHHHATPLTYHPLTSQSHQPRHTEISHPQSATCPMPPFDATLTQRTNKAKPAPIRKRKTHMYFVVNITLAHYFSPPHTYTHRCAPII